MGARKRKEKQEQIAVIKGIEAEVFEKLLYYIYTGKIYFKSEDLAALRIAADMYNAASLKDECVQYLSEHVTVENATTLYKSTINYMQQNAEAIYARPDWKKLLRDFLNLRI